MANIKLKCGLLSHESTTFIHFIPNVYLVCYRGIYHWSYALHFAWLFFAFGVQLKQDIYESELFKHENAD